MRKVLLAASMISAMSMFATGQNNDPFSTHLTWFWMGGHFTNCRPVESECLPFTSPIVVTDIAEVTIEHDGEVMLRADNIRVEDFGSVWDLEMDFNRTHLPKGQTYTVSIKPGSLALEDDPSVTNDLIELSYSIPEWIDMTLREPQPDKEYKELQRVEFYVSEPCKIAEDGNSKLQIYMEDNLVLELPIAVKEDDWNLFTVYYDMKYTPIELKKGVKYTLVLPQGAISSIHHDDIVNEEQRYELVGWSQSGIDAVEVAGDSDDSRPTVDMMGRSVKQTLPGRIYIRAGEKFVAR